MPRIAVVQMSSSERVEDNLARMEKSVEAAAAQGAEMVCFPEMAYLSAPTEVWSAALPRYPAMLDIFGQWARKYSTILIPGTLREPLKGENARFFNTLPVIHPRDGLIAKYRKIFLFKAHLPERDYDESKHCVPGNLVVTHARPNFILGFGVCFDLRFPELFRRMKARHAQIIVLPSCFTVTTGKAHWETLLRARAIENQIYIVAPAQVGKIGSGETAYGHSMVINPWGEILCNLGGTDMGMQVCDIDLAAIPAAAGKVDAWESRRDDIFLLD